MRVAFFTNRYPAVSHTFVRREIQALEALGVKVSRFALRSDPPDRLVDADDRAERTRTTAFLEMSRPVLLGRVMHALLRRPIRAVTVMAWALKLGRRSGVAASKMLAYWLEALLLADAAAGQDFVRVHFGTNGAIVARLQRRLGGPPYIVAYHGPDEFDAPERWDLRGTVAESAFVTAITHYCAAQLMRWSDPADWSRIRIVRCGVDARFFEAMPLPPMPLRLCAVARLAPQKGLPLLLDALGDIVAAGETPPHLDIAGDGPMRASLTAQADKLGLTDFVRFHGALDGAGIRAMLAKAHCFILPSFAEGLPVVIMEALASGRPVIASAIAGTGELVVAGRNGWLVAAGDRPGLAATIRAAMRTPDETWAAMSAAGRADVRAAHSGEVNGAVLHRLMQEQATG